VLLMITAFPMSASPNSCTGKRIKVKNVCGIVLDGSGVAIRGATVHIVAADGKCLSQPVQTNTDGQFSLTDAPQGESILAVEVTERQYNSWSLVRLLLQPLKITATPMERKCRKPLMVHMTGGVGCFGRVEKKPTIETSPSKSAPSHASPAFLSGRSRGLIAPTHQSYGRSEVGRLSPARLPVRHCGVVVRCG
jgi:hypothetical protein